MSLVPMNIFLAAFKTQYTVFYWELILMKLCEASLNILQNIYASCKYENN